MGLGDLHTPAVPQDQYLALNHPGSRPSSVLSTRSGRQPFMPTLRNKSSTASLRRVESTESLPGNGKAPTRDISPQETGAVDLAELGIYESLENLPVPVPVSDPRVRKSARSKASTSSRPPAAKKHVSPLKAALSSAGLARVALAPVTAISAPAFHLSPTKTASPKLSARPASPIKGRYVLDEVDRRSDSPSPSPVRARITQGISTRATGGSGANGTTRSRTGSPLKERPFSQLSSRGGLGISVDGQQEERVREPVEYDFEGEDPTNSSFVYQPPSEEADLASTPGAGSGSDLADSENVTVHIRLKPPKEGEECAWVPSSFDSTISLAPFLASQRTQRDAGAPHCFDGVHIGSSNGPLYADVARPLIRAALDGYDAVVFAYGQTASGKTFTLSGDERGREPGIIPRAIRDIFRGIQQSEDTREYLLRVSYLEIWNENVKDLLDPTNVPLVRDDRRKGAKGTVVHPLREEIVTGPAAVAELLERGQSNRHVGATDWNERSSRSHTCFKMTIESWERDSLDGSGLSPGKGGKKVRISELSLIDLAGSERYVSQGSDRRAEGAHINKSLLTLGKVILHLSERQAGPGASSSQHIPYRDSKLTRILQNSLSGNARVAVICTLNPAPGAVDESLSTLSFAHRVKKVKVHATRREIQASVGIAGSEVQALLLRYKLEAESLRQQVQLMQSGDDRIEEVQRRLAELERLKVRGGRRSGDDVLDSEDEGEEMTLHMPARPVSPMKGGSGPEFGEPSHVIREKLYVAEERIAELEAQLARRPPADNKAMSEDAKLRKIAELQKQVEELELVCEAQAAAPLPKVREDVEREWMGKVEALQKQLAQKDNYVGMLDRQCAELRKENKKLWKLAHNSTAELFSGIMSPAGSPLPDRKSARPASVIGAMRPQARVLAHSPLIQQARAGERGSISPYDSPATPRQLSNKRAGCGRRSQSLGTTDTLANLDRILAMAQKENASAGEESDEDAPKRRGASKRNHTRGRLQFLDTSMRDIQAEIESATTAGDFSFQARA